MISSKQRLIRAAATHLRVQEAFRPFYEGLGTIFMLHRVLDVVPSRPYGNRDIEISVAQLEQVIQRCQSAGMNIISLDDLAEVLDGVARGGAKPSSRFACFTIDDGYVDSLSHALPVFRKYGLPFAVYIATYMPEGYASLWWYALEDVLASVDEIRIENGEGELVFETHTDAEKTVAYHQIRDMLLATEPELRTRIVSRICAEQGLDLNSYRTLALDWQQIRELGQDPLVTLGAHSVHHEPLRALDIDDARREVLDSKKAIEEHTGVEVRHFAYPFGGPSAVGARECRIAAAAGFRTSTTTREANVFAEHARYPQCLPRVGLTPMLCDPTYMDLMQSGMMPALRHRLRKVITV